MAECVVWGKRERVHGSRNVWCEVKGKESMAGMCGVG